MTLRWNRRPRRSPDQPRTPCGLRIYAIGDVHGENRLLYSLLERISADMIRREPRNECIVFIGDLIDRGSGSAAILRGLYAQRFNTQVIVLQGNHEAAMLAAFDGDRNALAFWLRFGGIDTLASFGMETGSLDPADLDTVAALLRHYIPIDIVNWLRELPTSVRIGDYLFVHAGIRPGIPLTQQKKADLLWIRDDFLFSDDDHGMVVVHGHTITPTVDRRFNRIGIDTGAYETGVLSAIGLDGEEQWVIDTA